MIDHQGILKFSHYLMSLCIFLCVGYCAITLFHSLFCYFLQLCCPRPNTRQIIRRNITTLEHPPPSYDEIVNNDLEAGEPPTYAQAMLKSDSDMN